MAPSLGAGGRDDPAEVIGDGLVVRAGRAKGREGEPAPILEGGSSRVSNGGDQFVVLLGAGQDGHVGVVLGGRADQAGPADIDVFDRFGPGCVGTGDRGLEWIKVDDDEVDRQETLSLEGGKVFGLVAPRQDSAVDLGMQGLDPAAEYFGLAGVFGDFGDVDTGRQRARPATAAGKKLCAAGRQGVRQFDQTSLVENTDQVPGESGRSSRSWLRLQGCDSRMPQPTNAPHPACGHPLAAG